MANNDDIIPSASSPRGLVYQLIDDEKNILTRSLLEAQLADSIHHLRKQIYSDNKFVLVERGVDVTQLVLWKISNPPQIVEDDTAINELLAVFHQDSQSVAQKLEPAWEVRDYFEEDPPRKCLHLIVQVPRGAMAEGKRKREEPESHSSGQKRPRIGYERSRSSSLDPAPTTRVRTTRHKPMSDLYDSVWMQKKPPIARKSYSVPSSEDPLTEETAVASGKAESLSDGNVILDFDSIDLSSGFGMASLPDSQTKMLVRTAYPKVYDQILSTGLSHAIIGQPGIGKTYFLSYALVRRLIERKPTTYQTDNASIFWFSENGFAELEGNSILQSDVLDKHTWHLVDSNENLERLPVNLAATKGQIVQAASPKPDRYKEWTKQRSRSSRVLWLEPSPWEEIYVIAQNFTPNMDEIKLAGLSYAFHRYGPVTRTCLKVAGDEDELRLRDSEIQSTISKIPDNKQHWMSEDLLPHEVTHQIYYVQPSPDRRQSRAVPASRYISKLLWQRAQETDVHRAEEMLRALIRFPYLKAGAGRMLEPIVLTMLQQRGGTHSIEPLGAVANPQPSFTLDPLGSISSNVVSFESDQVLKDLIQQHPRKLITPYDPNYPSADAMMFTAEQRVWLFQVTLASRHNLSTTGLERVLKVVPAQYKPTTNRKWFYVIVTLDDQAIAPVLIQRKTPTLKRKWEGLVEMYILRIKEDKLYEAVRPS